MYWKITFVNDRLFRKFFLYIFQKIFSILYYFPAAAFQFLLYFWKGYKRGKTETVFPVLDNPRIYPSPYAFPAAA